MAVSSASDRDFLDTLSAIGEALAGRSRAGGEERVKALEEAIQARLGSLPPERASEILDAIEGRFPVRKTPAEEECQALRRELQTEKARTAELQEKLRRGASDEVRACLERISGKPVGPGQDDPKKLTAILCVLAEHANKTIGYVNRGIELWNLQEEKFSSLEEAVGSSIGRAPEAIAEGIKGTLQKVRAHLKAMIQADLDFTAKWVKQAQEEFSPETIGGGSAKGRAWETYVRKMNEYDFHQALMQGLRTYIDGKRKELGA